jgi:spore coat polysaccharide biosynthesis protein SpsF
MKVALILQARMGSTRLPGKSMMDLAGAPLVARMIERCLRCLAVDEIILATTTKKEDDCLASIADGFGVTQFRGSELDLVDRYYQAARVSSADVIVRIPADNPVPEPAEVDRIVAFHLAGGYDFSSNLAQVYRNGYPDGIGCEVFDTASLERVWRECSDVRRREHVHLNFFDYSAQRPADPSVRVGTVECPSEFRRPDMVLDVNTLEDYLFMAELYNSLYPLNPKFHVTEIIWWFDNVYRGSHGRLPVSS